MPKLFIVFPKARDFSCAYAGMECLAKKEDLSLA